MYPNSQQAIRDPTLNFEMKSVLSESLERIQLIDTPGYGNTSNVDQWTDHICQELQGRMLDYKK